MKLQLEEQRGINRQCEDAYALFLYEQRNNTGVTPKKQFRKCQAFVFYTRSFIVLQSYNTIVALIDRDTKVLYDILRLNYFYTSTSGMHITKFYHDFHALDLVRWMKV